MNPNRSHHRRWLALLLAVTIAAGGAPPAAAQPAADSPATAGDTASPAETGEGLAYAAYLREQENRPRPSEEIVLDSTGNPTAEQGAVPRTETDYRGEEGISLHTGETGSLSWSFTVRQAGVYHLQFRYYPLEGSGSAIVRGVRLDGAYPFQEADSIELSRRWANREGDAAYDRQGNQILVEQVEAPAWMTAYAWGMTGRTGEPYLFYLSEGTHTLELVGSREEALIRRLSFLPVDRAESVSYEELKREQEAAGYRPAPAGAVIRLQGEDAAAKSDQTMYPLADRTSPTVEPYDAARLRYNTVGGNQWTNTGQWMEWSFEVTEPGLYAIAAHFKQALKLSRASVRELYIDGELPFAEAKNIVFPYKSTWQSAYLSGEDGRPYQVYLSAGPHTIRLRAGLGYYRDVLTEARECLLDLNAIYREIVVVTGTAPDLFRDYHFDQMLPETLEKMRAMSRRLKELEAAVNAADGESGKGVADIQRLTIQLDAMLEDTDTIAQRLVNYKDNIASFGTWINAQMGQPLELDYLQLSSPETPLQPGDAGFFGIVAHYLRQFASSFVMDYATVGQTQEAADTSIVAWMTIGRDQSQILRQLINSRFTPAKKIAVDLQLVSAKALLPAVLAGKGPDVTINLLQADPLNLALRNGLYDLRKFADIDRVTEEFYPYSLDPFVFDGGLYALPETLTYPMLFYRKDLLADMGIDLKDLDRWDTLLGSVLPKLQKSSLTFGMLPTIQNYLLFCYQRGGEMYVQNDTASGLGSAAAIDSMKQYAKLFTQYGLPLTFDFANRFRTGEIPVAIADYTQYNLLTVFAPEIKGLWGMRPIPGTKRADGTVSHAAAATVTGAAMMAQTAQPEAGWEFLKWWVGGETQAAFGKSLESVVGAAARYNTANKEAMKLVGWDKDVRDGLLGQAAVLEAYREIPGGYITPRLFDFAYRDIVYDDADVRESMNNMVKDIDRELAIKRREYRLDER